MLEAQAIRSMSEWDAIEAAGTPARRSCAPRRRRSSADDPVAAADGDAAFHRLLSSYTKNGALRVLIGRPDRREPQGRLRRLLAARDGRAARSSSTARIVDALVDLRRRARPRELAREHMIDAARQYAAAQARAGGWP